MLEFFFMHFTANSAQPKRSVRRIRTLKIKVKSLGERTEHRRLMANGVLWVFCVS